MFIYLLRHAQHALANLVIPVTLKKCNAQLLKSLNVLVAVLSPFIFVHGLVLRVLLKVHSQVHAAVLQALQELSHSL